MKRRYLVPLAALGAMIALAALAPQQKPSLLILEWANRAPAEAPPTAVLIELGLKDAQAKSWSGRAQVSGAKVVQREGYRFRAGDRLIDPDAWEASSHRGLRLPPRQPQAALLEPVASVGIVLHLADVQPQATLTLEPKDPATEKTVVPLKDVLAGQTHLLWNGAAAVRRLSTATPVVTAKTEDDFPAAAYDGNGFLWVAYTSYTLKEEGRRVESEQLKEPPANFKAYHTPEFGDQLFVQYYHRGRWSRPAAVTGPQEDLVRCAIAVEAGGDAWVAYSANRQGNYDIYVRSLNLNTPEAVALPAPRMGPEQRLTKNPGPDLNPVMCTDQAGQVRLACQSWGEDGPANITLFTCKDGKWSAGTALPGSQKGENRWNPSLAAGPDGKVAVAYDVYRAGDYDVHVALVDGERITDHLAAGTARFEARPAVAYDAQGRLWLAYEEGPEKWGKDYGALDDKDGSPLYNARSVRVLCLQDGKLFKPAAELPTSEVKPPSLPFEPMVGNRFERATRYAYPKLGLDGKGRVWLAYRQKFGTRYSTHPGSYWLSFARRLDGDKWTEPVELHHADGLLDHRPVLLPHASGGLLMVHNTDGRHTTPEAIDNQIYASVLGLPGEPIEPRLVPHEPGKKDATTAAAEQAAVQRIRDYRIDAGGKKYQLLRGEFHRHTEISWDGGPDGSLEDMFRYGLDAAGMDWIGNGDHDSGAGREYSWWLIQKFTDAFHVKNAFTPMFTYERSVSYPHGHRNCMFVQRGVRTLPRLAEPDPEKRVGAVHADDTKMLYRYLKEMNGICAVHTSATSMGTDWRDNDPVVEPIVEIYQGDRMSYEHEGAPRAGYDPQTKKLPANVAGWFPAGFINHAFAKGYRLGFQASSDHWSTHISYCIVLAERHDRQAIHDGLKKRHCYGATDDIIVDVRSGSHLMGDEFKTSAAPTLQLTVIGTKPLAQIDILKDSQVVESIKPNQREYKGTWTDPKPTAGVHYYYVRVLQTDDELAWASPMWIDYTK
jgi:hypothetical protein